MTQISVVIPLYNHAAYIEAALDSVLRQTAPADEIIVLDDGSSDDGLARAQKVLAGRPNARALGHENIGAHATINKLVGMASGDYVAVLNSDDLFAPGKLARCRALAAADPTVDLIVGEAQIIDDKGRLQETGVAADWMRRALAFRDAHGLPQLSLLHENWVATTSNMVFSRAFWRGVGGFRDLRYCHDLDFLMACFSRGRVAIDRGVTHIQYRVHPRNTIGESLDKIRLEIAAVWANALFEAGPRIIGGMQPDGVAPFVTALEAKGLSALISLLQCARAGLPSAPVFYDAVLRSAATRAFLSHLR
ncbi:MAG TPA: glycosyltransferase [Roseomonas sp.]|nr:glycosyltransferase [Roseomonas sp.]